MTDPGASAPARLTSGEPAGLLKQLVAVPSLSGQEEALAVAIRDWARQRGLSCERAGRNVVLRAGVPGGRRLLFNSHLDTVPPVDGWLTDPFAPVEDGGRIVGLGANDAKASVAAMLCAVAACGGSGLHGELVLALTVEEESGGRGAGMEALIDALGRFDGVVIGEPTGLSICRAQKGLLVLELETRGVARHAAHAHRLPGPNAVVEAARAVLALRDEPLAPAHPLLGPVTCHVTTIAGGRRHNILPDRCVLVLDIRTVPGIDLAAVAARIGDVTGASVRVLSDRLKPFETDETAEIVAAARAVRPEAAVVGSATMSDGCWTCRFPTIKVGPGQTERSHTAGEYVTVSELEDGAGFYARLLTRFLAP